MAKIYDSTGKAMLDMAAVNKQAADILLLDERKADVEGSYESMAVGSAKTLEANTLTAVEFTKRVVPSSVGSGASKLSLLRGNTLVWNQMIPMFSNSVSEITNGVTWSYDSNTGLFTFQGTCTEGTSFRTNLIIPWILMLVGHKYLVFNAGRGGGNTPTLSVRAGSSYVPNNSYDTRNTIITKSEPIGSRSCAIYIRFRAGEIYDGSCYFNIFDLTRMFGEGNEPSSVEEFEALFPRENYAYADAYNTQWLMNFQGTGLKSTGSDFEQTLPLNVTTLKGKAEGSDTEVVMFPDGLKKAESVYDEIDFKNGVAIKRVGSVDLGTLGWTYIEGSLDDNLYSYFQAALSDIARTPKDKMNYICAKYNSISPISDTNMSTTSSDRIVARRLTVSGSNIMYIRDLVYSNATTFKAAMQGVMLNYELATPIVYHFEPMNNVYRVEQGGTEEVENRDSISPEGYSPLTAPLRADIRYGVDVVGILENLKSDIGDIGTILDQLNGE